MWQRCVTALFHQTTGCSTSCWHADSSTSWIGSAMVIYKLLELNTVVLGGAVMCAECKKQCVKRTGWLSCYKWFVDAVFSLPFRLCDHKRWPSLSQWGTQFFKWPILWMSHQSAFGGILRAFGKFSTSLASLLLLFLGGINHLLASMFFLVIIWLQFHFFRPLTSVLLSTSTHPFFYAICTNTTLFNTVVLLLRHFN